MNAALPETRLSTEIRSIGDSLLQAKPGDLPTISLLLGKLADLAHAMELELQLFRDMEAGRELRTGVRAAIAVQFSDEEDQDNVIFSEFGRKG